MTYSRRNMCLLVTALAAPAGSLVTDKRIDK